MVSSMRALIYGFSVALLACVFVGSALAASMGAVVGSFAMACMNNVDAPSGLSELNKGGAKLRPEHAVPFLKPHRGSAYLHRFDNGGEMIVAIKDAGGCKIYSKEALRQDVDGLIFEIFRREGTPHRVLANQKEHLLTRTTLAVTYKGKRLFLVVFGPQGPKQAGIFVEVSPAGQPPENISPRSAIDWPA